MQAPFVFENLNIYTHQGQGADMGEGEKGFLWEKNKPRGCGISYKWQGLGLMPFL
jgi:hypothetical protein